MFVVKLKLTYLYQPETEEILKSYDLYCVVFPLSSR